MLDVEPAGRTVIPPRKGDYPHPLSLETKVAVLEKRVKDLEELLLRVSKDLQTLEEKARE